MFEKYEFTKRKSIVGSLVSQWQLFALCFQPHPFVMACSLFFLFFFVFWYFGIMACSLFDHRNQIIKNIHIREHSDYCCFLCYMDSGMSVGNSNCLVSIFSFLRQCMLKTLGTFHAYLSHKQFLVNSNYEIGFARLMFNYICWTWMLSVRHEYFRIDVTQVVLFM